MRVVADEGVSAAVVQRLRQDGHTVLWIAELAPGAADPPILELARAEEALLITEDKDFGELVFVHKLVTRGVLLLRLAGLDPTERATLASSAVTTHGTEMLEAFTVLSRTSLRIRPRRQQ